MGAAASIPTDPSRRLEVIDAGFSRTGTLSFSAALEKLLDGPVHHGGTQIFNREDAYCRKISLLYKYRREGDRARLLKTLKECIAGFAACADAPMIHFLPELLELYPDVKVVLVTRDPKHWWQSFAAFGDNTDNSSLGLLHWILFPLPGARWFADTAKGFQEDPIQTHGRPASGPEFLEVHNEWVRSLVPKDRLLEMDLAGGWEPLCKFLGKPIPDEPFPRLNDREHRDKYMRSMLYQAGAAWAGVIVTVGFTSFGIWRAWQGMR
ncbi:P-loop containing nucleoside triphosphate hydrolase protein [Xylariaceae sp. FL1651]|nr:P-loop containing nucleoside triphosphate hydrolase protein [Xylariaceae sp. FL1651]